MVGVYKITNTINGKTYVGQSKNIEKRFYQHKWASQIKDTNLYKDIRELGVDAFKFEVIEECQVNELRAKELHYIHLLNPFYNEIGNPRKENTKALLRARGQEQWERMTDEEKQRVIKYNLKGRPVGHEVSEETREKLRIARKKQVGCPVMIAETGERFEEIQKLENHLGASSGTVSKYMKGILKTVKGYHIVKV